MFSVYLKNKTNVCGTFSPSIYDITIELLKPTNVLPLNTCSYRSAAVQAMPINSKAINNKARSSSEHTKYLVLALTSYLV